MAGRQLLPFPAKMAVMLAMLTLAAVAKDEASEEMERVLRKAGEYIVNGQELKAHSRPSLVHVKTFAKGHTVHTTPYYGMCGGTVLFPRWILTAAHCLHPLNVNDPSTVWVLAGGHKMDGKSHYAVEKVIVHDQFFGASWKPQGQTYETFSGNDIALLYLKDKLPLGPKIKLTHLNTDPNCPQPGDECEVMGWGNRWWVPPGTVPDRTPWPDVPHHANVTAMDHTVCQRQHGWNFRFIKTDPHRTVCMENTEGRGHCSGDSGGPVMCKCMKHGKKRLTQVGVVSWADKCGLKEKASVFARVSNYVPWLRSCVKSKGNCNKKAP